MKKKSRGPIFFERRMENKVVAVGVAMEEKADTNGIC